MSKEARDYITKEDVRRLREQAYNVPDGWSGNPWMEELADRLEALLDLPPEELEPVDVEEELGALLKATALRALAGCEGYPSVEEAQHGLRAATRRVIGAIQRELDTRRELDTSPQKERDQ